MAKHISIGYPFHMRVWGDGGGGGVLVRCVTGYEDEARGFIT